MPTYAAVLGHQPRISIAELSSVTSGFSLRTTAEKLLAFFDTSTDIPMEALLHLGGIVALAKKIESGSSLTLEDVPKLVANETASVKGKITFSLRVYGLPKSAIHDLYRRSKAELKRRGRPSRYIGTERKAASPVLLHHLGILDGAHGAEIFVFAERQEDTEGNKQESDLWIGRTVFAQDIDAYAKRDLEKPARDTKIGLLPPKLAQILLNFGAWIADANTGKKRATVFDPFCGMGVIPMEALLKGWNVLASDMSQKAVNGCERNIEWLRKERKILKKDAESVIWKQDATKPFTLKSTPDVIVTETTLGPPLTSRPTIKDAEKLRRENEEIQQAFLKNMAASFPHTPIICTWPVWYHSKGAVHLEKTWEALHDYGYRATLPPGIESDVPNRLSLVYRRPDQFVGREIVMLLARK